MIDYKIEEAIKEVYTFASDVDDFLTIKKQLLKMLPPNLRTNFSTRHPITKKQQTNEFERLLGSRWSELTGRPVIFK